MTKRNKANRVKPTSVRKAVSRELDRRTEMKEATLPSPTGANFTTGGTVAALSYIIAQGDNINNRNGDRITLRKLVFRMNAASTAAAVSVSYRVILFSDQTISGGLPSAADILAKPVYESGYNPVNAVRKRFKIFHDQMYTCVGATDVQERNIVITKRLKHNIFYVDSTGTTSNSSTGALYVLVIASAVVAGGWSANVDLFYQDN